MSADYYSIYKNNIFDLVATMKIHSLDTVDSINELLVMQYGTSILNVSDKTTWKYYMNICGIPHPTDIPITITSLDNGTIIEFTPSVLIEHPLTASKYIYGTQYYYNLLATYPKQERLILGVIYPADMQTAINAVNGQILTYAKYLIEPQEESLIYNIQQWINYYLSKWYKNAFMLTDSFYLTYNLAIMYMNLVPKIMNLRLAKCKTREAHSYHIRQYLASHQGLDIYYDYLTIKQAMWLYRNILYIERNAGSNDTLQMLISNLLTSINIPLTQYTMHHQNSFDTSYNPNYGFVPSKMNSVDTNVPTLTNNLAQILDMEIDDASGNLDFITNQFTSIDNQFKYSASDIVDTKLLVSNMTDYSDNTPNPISVVLFNHWLYMSSVGMYNGVVSFIDVMTGTTQSLCAQDAFIYMMYLNSIVYGEPLETIVSPIARRVTRIPPPTLKELLSKIDTSFFSNNNIANWILDNQVPLHTCESTNLFYTLINDIYNNQKEQLMLISNQNHAIVHGYVSNMVESMYSNSRITFHDTFTSNTGEILLTQTPITGMNYTSWLTSKSLPTIRMSVDEASGLINNILSSALGNNPDPTSVLANIQYNLIEVMKTLSGYTVQYISSINDSTIIPAVWSGVRVGEIECSGTTTNNDSTIIEVDDVSTIGSVDVSGTSLSNIEISTSYIEMGSITEPINVIIELNAQASPILVDLIVPLVKFNTSMEDNNQLIGVGKKSQILGYALFEALTDEQKRNLMFINYTHSNPGVSTSSININDIILDKVFNPMTYLSINTTNLIKES